MDAAELTGRGSTPAVDRDADYACELGRALAAAPYVARIDPVFGQCFGARRMLREQLVSVVVEVADQRDAALHRVQAVAYARNAVRSGRRIDCDTHQLGTGSSKVSALDGSCNIISRFRVGHGLDSNGRAAADAHPAYIDRGC